MNTKMPFVVVKILLNSTPNNVQCVYGPFASMDEAQAYADRCYVYYSGEYSEYSFIVGTFQPPPPLKFT